MCLLILMFTFLPLVHGIFQAAEYLQTKVFYELESCPNNKYYSVVGTTSAFSRLDCVHHCSSTTECRRIMFDTKTNICSMFDTGENCFSHENIQDKVCFRQKWLCSEVNCTRCPIGYYGDSCQYVYQDCSDGQIRGAPPKNLMSYIQPSTSGKVVEVKCLFQYGGLTFIHDRYRQCKEVDFNRTWDEYENGFGYKHGEFWLGLKHVYDILQNYINFELVVYFNGLGGKYHCFYKQFSISNSTDGYRFSSQSFVGHAKWPCGDSLTKAPFSIVGRPFSAYDRDYSNNNCPDRFKGGWWYLDDPVCSRANLNGRWSDSNPEAELHWSDDFGPVNNYDLIHMRLRRL